MIAPIFVLAVLASAAFAAVVMLGVSQMVTRGQVQSGGTTLALGPWQIWAFGGWLVACASLVVGRSLVERRKRIRRSGRRGRRSQ